MKSNFIICSHNNGEAAKALASKLGCRLVSHSATGKIPSGKIVINLGCSPDHPAMLRVTSSSFNQLLNDPARVSSAQSKQQTLALIGSNGVPHVTTKEEVAYRVGVLGETYVARTLDRGSSGEGITLVTPEVLLGGSIPTAKVYTKAINKRREYRVHIGYVNGSYRIIDVTRKIRRPGVDDTDRPFVWNHDNDFIFVRTGVNRRTIPNDLIARARESVARLGLVFGAVDIVVERGGRLADARSYVLEVNTSPGMEGTTLERYAQFFAAHDGMCVFVDWEATVEEGADSPE